MIYGEKLVNLPTSHQKKFVLMSLAGVMLMVCVVDGMVCVVDGMVCKCSISRRRNPDY